MADVGAAWHLRYRAASASAYKWEVVGASPVQNVVATTQAIATIGSWVNLATTGPEVTPALAGDYLVSFGAWFQSATANSVMGMAVGGGGLSNYGGGSGALNGDDPLCIDYYQVTAEGPRAYQLREKIATLTAAKLDCRYRVNNSTGSSFGARTLTITPIRVG